MNGYNHEEEDKCIIGKQPNNTNSIDLYLQFSQE